MQKSYFEMDIFPSTLWVQDSEIALYKNTIDLSDAFPYVFDIKKVLEKIQEREKIKIFSTSKMIH